jgi:NAD(P)-dependent dehydrogenase (short-subunit alcohol dehydrogenase family)
VSLSQFRLDGRVALITGAAGGLGSAFARGFAEAGAAVTISDLQAEPLETLAADIRSTFDRPAQGFVANVVEKSQVDALVAATLAEHGRIDVLVNCAGITKRAKGEEFPEEWWDRILAVNLKGTFLACQAVGREMIRQGSGGSIVNLASVAGLAGLAESVAYCASKGAVVQVTRTLAAEWAQHNIRVNALAPSWFETQMGLLGGGLDKVYAPGATLPTPEWMHAHTVGAVPLGRRGKPEELVGAALFLASDASAMVTGHILAVDGGFLAV